MCHILVGAFETSVRSRHTGMEIKIDLPNSDGSIRPNRQVYNPQMQHDGQLILRRDVEGHDRSPRLHPGHGIRCRHHIPDRREHQRQRLLGRSVSRVLAERPLLAERTLRDTPGPSGSQRRSSQARHVSHDGHGGQQHGLHPQKQPVSQRHRLLHLQPVQ